MIRRHITEFTFWLKCLGSPGTERLLLSGHFPAFMEACRKSANLHIGMFYE